MTECSQSSSFEAPAFSVTGLPPTIPNTPLSTYEAPTTRPPVIRVLELHCLCDRTRSISDAGPCIFSEK